MKALWVFKALSAFQTSQQARERAKMCAKERANQELEMIKNAFMAPIPKIESGDEWFETEADAHSVGLRHDRYQRTQTSPFLEKDETAVSVSFQSGVLISDQVFSDLQIDFGTRQTKSKTEPLRPPVTDEPNTPKYKRNKSDFKFTSPLQRSTTLADRNTRVFGALVCRILKADLDAKLEAVRVWRVVSLVLAKNNLTIGQLDDIIRQQRRRASRRISAVSVTEKLSLGIEE